MAANATIAQASILHSACSEVVAYFGTAATNGTSYFSKCRANYCTKVVLQTGADPSYAVIAVNMNDADETAPALAAKKRGALQEAVKHNAPVYVAQDGRVLFWGHVAEVEQDLDHDRLIVTARDLRWRLNKTQVVGSFWVKGTPDSTKYSEISYRQGEPFIVNPGGQPNMQWATHSGYGQICPVMCPVNYGGDITGQGAARHWTARAVLKALRMFGDPLALGTGGVITGAFSSWIPQWPSGLVWPVDFDVFLQGLEGSERKFPEMRLDGAKMTDILQRVISCVGPYSLYLGSDGEAGAAEGTLNFKSNLSIVRTAYNGEGLGIARPVSGKPSQRMTTPRYISGGSLNENSDELYGKVVAGGGPVYIERRIDNDTGGGLQQQWTAADQTAVGTYIAAKVNVNPAALKQATAEALAFYPTVGAAYALTPTFDFQAGTTEGAYPRGTAYLRPILPHLLAAYTNNAAGTTPQELSSYRKPILVEYKDGSVWKIAGLADGLRIDADGTFWLTGLRDRGLTLLITTAGVVPNVTVTVTARKLRLTVAIPCDHRLIGEASMSNIKDMTDSDRILEQPETLFIDAGDLYDQEIQKASWPIPESVTGSAVANAELRNDATLVAGHAKSRWQQVCRLKKKCVLRFPRLDGAPLPGTAIKELMNTGAGDTYPVRGVVQRLTITNEPGNQQAEVECAI